MTAGPPRAAGFGVFSIFLIVFDATEPEKRSVAGSLVWSGIGIAIIASGLASGPILDGGGSWRVTRLQQLDFHVGFGLNSSSPDHFFGVGYSFRLDGLLGGSVCNSP